MLIKSPVKFRSEELCDKKHVDLLGMFLVAHAFTGPPALRWGCGATPAKRSARPPFRHWFARQTPNCTPH